MKDRNVLGQENRYGLTNEPDELDLDDILEPGMAHEFLSEMREAHGKLESEGRAAVRRAMIRAYQIADVALKVDDVWTELCNSPLWRNFKQRPKITDQPHALKFVVRLTVGFGDETFTSKASKRYRAMKSSFEAGEPASKIGALLDEHNGLEGLLAHQRRMAAAQTQVSDVPEETVTLVLGGPDAKRIARREPGEYILLIIRKKKRKNGVEFGLCGPLLPRLKSAGDTL